MDEFILTHPTRIEDKKFQHLINIKLGLIASAILLS